MTETIAKYANSYKIESYGIGIKRVSFGQGQDWQTAEYHTFLILTDADLKEFTQLAQRVNDEVPRETKQ